MRVTLPGPPAVIKGIYLGFEELLKKDMDSEEFGGVAYIRSFKGRPHMSKSSMERDNLARYVDAGSWLSFAYDETRSRYIAATSIVYDLLVSVYDVNSRSLFVCRVNNDPGIMKKPLERFLRSIKGERNVEARIIGMQNNQRLPVLSGVLGIINENRIPVYEIDLFGDQMRHIAVDSRLGPSYNILMLDRIYRPGELKNTTVIRDLEDTSKKQS